MLSNRCLSFLCLTVSIQLGLASYESSAQSPEGGIVAGAQPNDAPITDLPDDVAAQTGSVGDDPNSGTIAPNNQPLGDALNFQADLFTGRFTYKIPIFVAPGRQGAQPSLNLGYVSGGGNGWCGVGWSLDTGYIQRDVRKGVPIGWSGNSPDTHYSSGYIANFGGVSSPLILVSDPHAYPLVYRQQVETAFLTYSLYSDNHWEIVDKGGNTFWLGEGLTNRVENSKTGWTANSIGSTFRWALNRVIDVNGNKTMLSYAKDNQILYLTNITYNANTNSPSLGGTHTVDFVLGSRSDTNISYVSGFRMSMEKRLTEIQVKAGGSNVTKYALGYISSPSTGRSLLDTVTRYGSDYSSALPALKFRYQVKPFQFEAATDWTGLNSQGDTTSDAWNSIRSIDGNNDYRLNMVDIDGDGLPDRVMRPMSAPYSTFIAQRNTGTNFASSNPSWGALSSQGQTGTDWNSTTSKDINAVTSVDFLDINGDGYPDRVMRKLASPFTNFVVELASGICGSSSAFAATNGWGPVTNDDSTADQWLSIRAGAYLDLVDMNGDGLPDRVSRKVNSPYDKFRVQLNNGNGFQPPVDWGPLDSQGQTGQGWNSINTTGSSSDQYVILADINGDGLPDRVMRLFNTPYTSFAVQFNNGAGFEPWQAWGPIDGQGATGDNWNDPICSDGTSINATLMDINGDRLLDRVMRKINAPYTNFVVQINTGSGFAAATNWGPLDSQGQTGQGWNSIWAADSSSHYTYVDLFDINGDGLPDRVMRQASGTYSKFVVQLNKGPFPDLLSTVENGIGGGVQVSYVPSTTLDNRSTNWTGDPWRAGIKSLLPFPVYVVSQISAFDGLGDTNTTSYAFKGGYFNFPEREFRGFSQAEVTDALLTKTRTYFHQSGGRDSSALGEYQDQGSEAKKGIPFRIELIGNDAATNSVTLNKVEESLLNTNGWYFPFISQTIVMNYEGVGSYRAIAKQLSYDTNTGNLTAEASLGEVTNVVISSQTFTDVGNDSIYTWTTYASLGGIKNKPSSIKITSDSSGTTRLRETQFSYDSRGNVTTNQVWLSTAGAFITTVTIAYDTYGNPIRKTDAAGITTTNVFDSSYQQFITSQIIGSFTNSFVSDTRSGATIQAIDVKGLVASNYFDVFYRPRATYISTNAYGTPTLWKTKMDYTLGGISSGVSSNCVHKQVNDAIDSVNGFETFMYADGLGRAAQTRAESETGQYRVTDTLYDERGKPVFQTLPFFSSGSAFTVWSGTNLGTLTEYDAVGRAFRVTPAVQVSLDFYGQPIAVATGGDTGSPVAATTTAFSDGSNPWASSVTDAEGKVKKAARDAYGRTISITEVTGGGNYVTTFKYDLVGNLTNVIDNASNSTVMAYDSLGRKTSMIDPDMGFWFYYYDNAGRLIQQTDARTNSIVFLYNDPIGRLVTKQIFNSNNVLQFSSTNYYDSNYGDSAYTVLKGQLYMTTDREGWQKRSYDVRGRVLKSSRYLNVKPAQYVIQSTYDDADRVTDLIYPSATLVKIHYDFDNAGNITNVVSKAGTGANAEVFYRPIGFNAVGQSLGMTYGNGLYTTNNYFANSKRIQRLRTSAPVSGWHQDLQYTYDNVSNLKSIVDSVFTSGITSASISSVTYDDLHRLQSLYSTAYSGTRSFAYSSIGNILTNGEAASGSGYFYGAKPHAATYAFGRSYAYDLCGNMTSRGVSGGTQSLSYDEENRLIQVSGAGGPTVSFGYDLGGERLWRYSTTAGNYSVWIGGLYEERGGKILCHVFAGGRRIATFEPQAGQYASVDKPDRWAVARASIDRIVTWPLMKGRIEWSLPIFMFAGIASICLVARRRAGYGLQGLASHYTMRRGLRRRQCVTFVSLAALLVATTPTNVAAQTYTPVFYYYHPDHLGSTTVLTDRTGVRVDIHQNTAFGREQYNDPTSAFEMSNRFTGQILDDETGLYYYGARYYDPELGRFIQPDTIVPGAGNPQSLNRYSYVNNNPLNATDPSGHGGIGGFFSAVFKAETRYWSSGSTWVNIGIGFVLGGFGGAIVAAAMGHTVTGIGASFGYAFGGEIGRDAPSLQRSWGL